MVLESIKMMTGFRNTNYSGNYNTISGSFDYR